MTIHYDISGILRLTLHDDGTGRQLQELLDVFRVKEAGEDIIELTLCPRKRMPQLSGGQAAGIYKGIPWRIVFERDDDDEVKRIFFSARFFVTFLALRIVLLPCIKDVLTQQGGFSVLGSVFRYRGTTFFLFGQPGSGKTWLTLRALEKGGSFIADNELLISDDGTIRGLFNEIELRFRTVRDTHFWRQLSMKQKMRLVLFHFISFVSCKRISFNISLSPAELGIETETDSSTRNLVVVHLSDHPQRTRLTVNDMIEAVIAYEKWYQSVFRTIFSLDLEAEESDLLRNSMRSFFSGCTMWRLSTGCTIDDILALSPDLHP